MEVPLIVHKILEHGELADGEFSFELRNSRMLFPLTARNDSVDTNEFIMDEDGKQILVMLPYAEIYGIPSIDTDSFEKYLDEAGIFTSGFDIEDHNDMIEDIQDQAVDRAIEVGIIDRANENARELVNNLVSGMLQGMEGYEDYSIVVTTVEPELSAVSNGK